MTCTDRCCFVVTCLLLGTNAAAAAQPPVGFHRVTIVQPRQQAQAMKPFAPLPAFNVVVPKHDAHPLPVASPEYNPLKRRRMAMPGMPPGPDADLGF